MLSYHEKTDAPQASQALMEETEKGLGTLLNLHKLLAGSPLAYKIYNEAAFGVLLSSSLSALEAQVVFMTANRYNECSYCMAGHSWMMDAAGMPKDVIEALRSGQAISDEKLQALHVFTEAILEKRGKVGAESFDAFIAAGYTENNVLDVLTGVAAKTISNYSNSMSPRTLDAALEPFAWTPA